MADDAAARAEKRQELDRLFEARRKKKEERRQAKKQQETENADSAKGNAAKAAAAQAAADQAAADQAAADQAAAQQAAAIAAQAKLEADRIAAQMAAEREADRIAAAAEAKRVADEVAAAAEAKRQDDEAAEAARVAEAQAARAAEAAQAQAEAEAEREAERVRQVAARKSATCANGKRATGVKEADKEELKARLLREASDRVSKQRKSMGIQDSRTPDPPVQRTPDPPMSLHDMEEEQDMVAIPDDSGVWDDLDADEDSSTWQEQFDEMDLNQDGVITKDEFHRAKVAGSKRHEGAASKRRSKTNMRGQHPGRHQQVAAPVESDEEDPDVEIEYDPDDAYQRELDHKNAEIQLLRQQLVAMGSPPVTRGNSRIKGMSNSRQSPGDASRVDAVSPAKHASRRRQWMCKVHPEEEIRFLSRDSYELLCRDCLLVGAHQGHSYCTIDDAAQDARKVLQGAMDQVLHKEHDLSHAVKLLHKSLPSIDRQQQAVMEEISKEFGKIQAAVDLRRAEIEHAVLESFRRASSHSGGRFKKLQQQQQALREACNRAHDALHAYSDMDLLSNAAEIEAELEQAAAFPDSSSSQEMHSSMSIPEVEFNTESLFDAIAQFGSLLANRTAAPDPVEGSPQSDIPQRHRQQRPKSAGSVTRSRMSSPATPSSPASTGSSQPRPASAGRSRHRTAPSVSRSQNRVAQSPTSSRFKWLTAPVTMGTSKPPIKSLSQRRHFAH